MNKLIKTLGSLLATLIVFSASAQKVEFEELVHDFGTIQEELGSVTHAFKFTNTGDKPIVISNVTASCGCTTPGWTKEPVKPGETGEVLATYRTSAGSFNKSLTVTPAGQPNIVLHIKGNVTRKPEDFTVTYPQTFGELRAKNKRDFSFSQIFSNQTTPTQTIEIVNAGEAAVTVAFENVPEYLIVNAVPPSLSPKQKGQITVSVSGEKSKKFGYSNDQITVKAGNAKETIKITSIIAEKIEQTEKIPASEVEQSLIDLGKLTDTKSSGVISIKNVGNADLLIKSFSTDNEEIVSVALKKEIKIKPGKTGTVKVSAQNLKKGDNVAQVYLATNDPGKPLLRIMVKADVN
ncbi:MAG: DUF1573 domain-containing protein [Prevotellaceae bacterium]|nr:DUF1573 domain-containing protein [Prevotellaceae bacterium]